VSVGEVDHKKQKPVAEENEEALEI